LIYENFKSHYRSNFYLVSNFPSITPAFLLYIGVYRYF
jgi:hypothetical protein